MADSLEMFLKAKFTTKEAEQTARVMTAMAAAGEDEQEAEEILTDIANSLDTLIYNAKLIKKSLRKRG